MINVLVKFKLAHLAKDKNFNIKTKHYYNTNNPLSDKKSIETICTLSIFSESFINEPYTEINEAFGILQYRIDNYTNAPTQSALQKWLRDEHSIYVSVIPSYIGNDKKKRLYFELSYGDKIRQVEGSGYKETYEEALEEGLFNALKIIKL